MTGRVGGDPLAGRRRDAGGGRGLRRNQLLELGAGILGLLILASFWSMRRRWSDRGTLTALPAGRAEAVGVVLASLVTVITLGTGLDTELVQRGVGAGRSLRMGPVPQDGTGPSGWDRSLRMGPDEEGTSDMAESVQFTIGAQASGTDGVCGTVSRVVVDPIGRVVTHLVVEPEHRTGLGRLVPLDLVDVTAGEIRLRCSRAEFDQLDPAEETQFLPGGIDYPAYDPQQVLAWPYYPLGGIGLGGPGVGGLGAAGGTVSPSVTYDTLPAGEVGIRRGEHVHATDGSIGRVQGLVIEPRGHHVTHLLLQEGHLWGRREVAIPISAVAGVDAGVRLRISKQEVEALPPVVG